MTASRTPPYRVGIIGVGRMGSNHARAYVVNPKTELVAAADTDPENLELFQRRFGVNVYGDYHEMLAKERLDIAAPVLPVSVNPQAVIDCAEAGVGAIFSEKPIASSLADADRMVETCRPGESPLPAATPGATCPSSGSSGRWSTPARSARSAPSTSTTPIARSWAAAARASA